MNLFAAVPAILIMALLVIYPLYFIAGTVRARRQKRRGPSIITLTLWLVVVMLIVSAVAPSFLHFASRSRQSEAKTYLASIATAQRAYHGDTGRYAETFAAMGWSPDNSLHHYTFFCGKDVMFEGKGYVPVAQRPGSDWPFPVTPASTADAFTCMAIGNLDNDPFMDIWSVNDRKEIVNVLDDVTDLPAGAPDPRLRVLYYLGAAFALFVVLIVVDAVRIRKGKKVQAAGPTASG